MDTQTNRVLVAAIACVQDSDYFQNKEFHLGIGNAGKLLYRCEADMNFFVKMTSEYKNSIVIMGRQCISLKYLPLKDRINALVTHSPETLETPAGINKFRSPEEALLWAKNYPGVGKIWIIGGEQIYKVLLSECDELYLTRIPGEKPADKFFPEYVSQFRHVSCLDSGVDEKSELHYQIHYHTNIKTMEKEKDPVR